MAKSSKKSVKKKKTANNTEVKYLEYLIFLTKRAIDDAGDFGGNWFKGQLNKMEKELEMLKN